LTHKLQRFGDNIQRFSNLPQGGIPFGKPDGMVRQK